MTTEQIDEELKRIQESIPKTLLDHVVSEVAITPTIRDMVEKALVDPNFPQEKKEQLQILKDRGYFVKVKATQNDKIANMIDQYVDREIKKSVKAGRLPNKKQLAEIIKQNVKK